MGWCSGTRVFDAIVPAILDDDADKLEAIKTLIVELEDMDWDCQSDSDYYWNDPTVQQAFRELHPHWFEDDE